MRRTCLALAMFALLCSQTSKADDSKSDNAAPIYEHALELIGDTKIPTDPDPTDPEVIKLAESLQPVIVEIRRANDIQTCQWKVERNDDGVTLTRYLGTLYKLSDALSLYTKVSAARAEDAEHSWHLVLDQVKLSHRALHHSFTVNYLVFLRGRRLAMLDAATLFSKVSKDKRQKLIQLLTDNSALPTLGDCLRADRDEQIRIVKGLFAKPDPAAELCRYVGQSETPDFVRQAFAPAVNDSQELKKAIAIMKDGFDRATANSALRHGPAEEADAQFNQLRKGARPGDLLLTMFVPDYQKVRLHLWYDESQVEMFKVSHAILNDEKKALADHADPYDGKGFELKRTDDGFELLSNMQLNGERLSLEFPSHPGSPATQKAGN